MPVQYRLGAVSLALKNKQRKIQISPGILHCHSPTQDSSDNSILVWRFYWNLATLLKWELVLGDLVMGKHFILSLVNYT